MGKENNGDENKGKKYQEILQSKGLEEFLLQETISYGASEWELGDKTYEDYLALPEDVRVELIDGVFYDIASPSFAHQHISSEIRETFGNYIKKKGGNCMAFAAPLDVKLDCDDKTIVQPDVFVVCERHKIKKNRLYGCPDLVVEVISPSTRKKDMDLKRRKYKNAGVKEYWLVFPKERKVLVYLFGGLAAEGQGLKEQERRSFDRQVLYSFEDEIPVGIWNGECKVDFKAILAGAEFLLELGESNEN